MKTPFFIIAWAIAGMFFTQPLIAQNAERSYVIAEYMKVKPGMNAKYLECEKVWKMIQQERKKAGLITGWEIEQVIMPSGTHAEYEYLTITHLKNWDAIDKLNNSWDDKTWAMLTKNLTAAQKELANNAELYRDLIKREIWAASDMAFGPNGGQAKFRVENFMKIPANGWDDWMEMETRFVKPVHLKNIELGNRAGWIITTMVFPHGEVYPYDASTVDFYNTWADMDKDEGATWETVYPDMSNAHIGNRIESTRTLVRSEVRMLIDAIE